MADTIVLKIENFEPPKCRCATCDNTISESRAFVFQICDECVKDLREIIKERRLEKEKAEFKFADGSSNFGTHCAEIPKENK